MLITCEVNLYHDMKLVQGVFARVQKGIERCKNGLVHGTIWV